MRHALAIVLSSCLFGCTQLPDVPEPPNTATAEYPPLVSLDNPAIDTSTKAEEDLRIEQSVTSRAAALNARAARLRTTSFD